MCFTTKRGAIKACEEILGEVNSHPYLGVVLDNKIRWSPHIEVISSSANYVLTQSVERHGVHHTCETKAPKCL